MTTITAPTTAVGTATEAEAPARTALYLDPQSPRAGNLFLGLRARLRAGEAAAGPSETGSGLEIIP